MIHSKPKDGKSQCTLCPHECVLDVGEVGLCFARVGVPGGVYLRGFGKITTMAAEPVEKKPLFHYLPGTKTLSVGFYGCNMSCDYCQNWTVSQKDKHETTKTIMPMQLVKTAVAKGCQSICFTYNEPTIYIEYILSTAFYARQDGIKIILKTNALLNKSPWGEILREVDAINIDWKGDSAAAKKKIGSDFDTIPNILAAIDSGKHVEISIPVYADSILEDYTNLIIDVGWHPNTPIHLLKVFPAHITQLSNTTGDDLIEKVRKLFSPFFHYVYSGNCRNTICPTCCTVNVTREGYQIKGEEFSATCEKCSVLSKQMHG